jgi:hypothetical protein
MSASQAENPVLQAQLVEIAEEAGFDPEQLKRMGVWVNFERAALGVVQRCAACAQSYPDQTHMYRDGIDSVRDRILSEFGLPPQ